MIKWWGNNQWNLDFFQFTYFFKNGSLLDVFFIGINDAVWKLGHFSYFSVQNSANNLEKFVFLPESVDGQWMFQESELHVVLFYFSGQKCRWILLKYVDNSAHTEINTEHKIIIGEGPFSWYQYTIFCHFYC